jgi:hypothetical protein
MRMSCSQWRNAVDGEAVYFQRRATEEFLAAANSQHPKAREAHLKIAECYQDLASARGAC